MRQVAITIVAVLWLAAAPVSASGQPAVATPPDDAWGSAVAGVQLGLRVAAAPSPPTVVELPAFELRLRNLATQIVPFNYVDLLSTHIEVDGVWYSSPVAITACPRSQQLDPGTSHTHTLVYPNALHAADSTRLIVTAGRHAIRVMSRIGAFTCGRPPSGPPLELISNRLTIDIVAVDPLIERQALIDAASTSGAGESLSRLIERYPDAVLQAVQAALRRAGDASSRGILISWLAKVPGDDVTAFLRSKLGADTEFASRSAAAWNLFRRDDPQALPASIAAWREMQTTVLSQASVFQGRDPFSDFATRFAAGGFITILASSGDATAVEALARDFASMPLDIRLSAVGVFLQPETGQINVMLNGGPATLPGGEPGRAIERLLVAALDDTEPRLGMQGTINGLSYVDPRVCDMAALVFATRWPATYAFRWFADAAMRDAQIDEIRTAWRAQRLNGQ